MSNTAVVQNHTTDFDGITTATSMVIELDEVDATQAKGTGASGSFGQRSAEQKEADMRILFAANPTVVQVGQLLALKANGVSFAQHLKDGKTLQFSRVKLSDGTVAELKAPVAISLSNVSVWGCPSCKSAHGTNVGASAGDGVSIKGLESNRFYYGVESKTLFTVSRTCYDQYVAGIQLHKQIVDRIPAKQEVAKKSQEVKK